MACAAGLSRLLEVIDSLPQQVAASPQHGAVLQARWRLIIGWRGGWVVPWPGSSFQLAFIHACLTTAALIRRPGSLLGTMSIGNAKNNPRWWGRHATGRCHIFHGHHDRILKIQMDVINRGSQFTLYEHRSRGVFHNASTEGIHAYGTH